MDVHELLRRVEGLRAVDGVGERIARTVRGVLRKSHVDDAVRGRWLGHPLHPLMVTVPIGAYVCAAAMDAGPGNRDAARKLVGIGLAATPPAVLLGLADYAELTERQRRVGVVHAAVNAVASGCYVASYLARRRGAHGRGAVLGMLGMAVLGAGGALGGHLAYAQAAGVHRWQSPRTEVAAEGRGAPEEIPAGAMT